MKRVLAIFAGLLAVLAHGAGDAAAERLEAIIGDRAAIGLPAALAVTAVHVPRSLAAVELDAATVDVDFAAAARPGRASVKVRLGGRRPRTVFVPITIARVAEVAVASRALVPGEHVTAADVRWERRPVDGHAAVVAPIGQQVAAPIAADEAFDDARLTAPPPVARGTAVRVEVRRGAVAVHARGKLEGAARIGAPARVRLINGALVDGTLAAAARVVVEAP